MSHPFIPVARDGAALDDHAILVAMGCFDGISQVTASSFKSNTSTTVALIANEGGGTPFRSSASLIQVASGSADDNSSGVGLQTILLQGYDVNYVKQSEVIVMNGATKVASTLQYRSVDSIIGVTFGADGRQKGNIYVSPNGTAHTAGLPTDKSLIMHGCAVDGLNQTSNVMIPAGYSGFILTGSVQVQESPVQVGLFVRSPNGSSTKVFEGVFDVGSHALTSGIPTQFPEKTGLEFRARTVSGTGIMSFFMTVQLVANKLMS